MRDPSADRPKRAARLPGRRAAFRAAALLGVPLAVLAVLEVVLRIMDVGYDERFLVPAGSSVAGRVDDRGAPDLWKENDRFAWRFFPTRLARASQPIRLRRDVESGARRIVILGGSAAMGDPEPACGLGRMLEVVLRERGGEVEVVNAAMTAVNSHVVREIADDLAAFEADAWVVMLGNNEVAGPFGPGSIFGREAPPYWLVRALVESRHFRTGQWAQKIAESGAQDGVPEAWRGMEMFEGREIPWGAPSLERVYDALGRNLDAMVRAAAGAGVTLVLCTVPVNLADCSPFASVHGRPLDAGALARWENAFERGRAALADGRPDDAMAAFREAESIDPDHAELVFQIARCHAVAGDERSAGACYRRAADLDALRFRADSRVNAVIRAAASRAGSHVRFVDLERAFESASPLGVPGGGFFHEHVHLTVEGNHLAARAVADALPMGSTGGGAEAEPEEWPDIDTCRRLLGLSPLHEVRMLETMRARLRTFPFNGQSCSAEREQGIDVRIAEIRSRVRPDSSAEWRGAIESAIARHPTDWMLRQQLTLLLEAEGLHAESVAQWREIVRIMPHYRNWYHLGAALNRAGEWSAAVEPLRTAIGLRPDFPLAVNSLGVALSRTGRPDEAISRFEAATILDPTMAEPHYNRGLVEESEGRADEAMASFRRALAIDPDLVAAHYRLGELLVAGARFREALPHYARVAESMPHDPAARTNLALLHQKLGRLDEAVAGFEEVLRLDPSNDLARGQLEALRASRTPPPAQ